MYILLGFTFSRLVFDHEDATTPEQELELDHWFVLVALVWPAAFLICAVITLIDIISDIKIKKK